MELLQLQTVFRVAVIFQFMITMDAGNITLPSVTESILDVRFEWSAWSTWSPCSKTCGGGVSVQERHCIPRNESILMNSTFANSTVLVRETRQAGSSREECIGVDRRYHECNTAPCPGGFTNTRAQQCSSYNRRPFRGQFYTWVPFIDGDAPCILNCRPMGHQFYASLALAADGTRCTAPGARAMCVQGQCKVVGQEAILAVAGAQELRCGRRMVSGLFSRPQLPLGYSYVTTVPQGACRLNISEIISSENYIALKLTNSSYIINGEFAVSTPGTYDAAGTRFLYTRIAGLDSIFAYGPILHPLDIMILYTQPNPSIKYSFYTESKPGEIDTEQDFKSTLPDVSPTVISKHKHHTTYPYSNSGGIPKYPEFDDESVNAENDLEENIVGTRKFVWKIVYTQCSRSCGGGMQVGKYHCIEPSANGVDRDVSQLHCNGSPPTFKRRRCNNFSCPPRWRAAAWSKCPNCGPATRTRLIGCVQDHFRGITKISDYKCPLPKPNTTEICDIPNCSISTPDEKQYIETKRITRVREDTESFHDGPVYTLSLNGTEVELGTEYSNNSPSTAGWLYTDWSNCVGWCVGGGIQSRGVICADPSGCAPKKTPDSSKSCKPKESCEPHEGQWFTGEWSACSAKCDGLQIRGVLCIGGSGRHLRDTACKSPKPTIQRECENDCLPSWYYSDWSPCTGNCTSGIGLQRRTVWCARDNNGSGAEARAGAESEAACSRHRPATQQVCTLKCTAPTIPPDLSIESQKREEDIVIAREGRDKQTESKGCADKLNNCVLAVQARLCHYNYYLNNCCNSCKGR